MASLDIAGAAHEAAQHIGASLRPELRNPGIGIICGSGLGGMADAVRVSPRWEIGYNEIPRFPTPTGTFCRVH